MTGRQAPERERPNRGGDAAFVEPADRPPEITLKRKSGGKVGRCRFNPELTAG